ncbi:DUF896 domain-containing protein [Acidaminobacter sp.]|uniref:DUF896 domain-containing protein n=1 Tax=Acidaminobacter sp. TaxID=1872102 RepID=UPI00137CF7D3|nr:DUF896 domain-containing protein [Acidaminobacter sp.]MDK9709814.1 DUF896 domain-containing protein [Acidaminobacter sp.]MZQ96599.1 DUF896 domain-containing protein [Acidaminobacter sp.]
MLSKEKLDRINILANKAKNGSLTESEKIEQRLLREEYLEAFRENFKRQLDNIEVRYVDEDGNPVENQKSSTGQKLKENLN